MGRGEGNQAGWGGGIGIVDDSLGGGFFMMSCWNSCLYTLSGFDGFEIDETFFRKKIQVVWGGFVNSLGVGIGG